MGEFAMRIRMTALAAGLLAGALAFGGASADADPGVALNGFYANSPMSVIIDAPPAAMGEMCYIIQGGQLIGGGTLTAGVNMFAVATNGLGNMLTADGPALMAVGCGTFDDTWGEE